MMQDYNQLLMDIQNLKNVNPVKRLCLIMSLKGTFDYLQNTIQYQKLKQTGALIDNKFLEEVSDHDLLVSVFGSNDIKENERKLKELRKTLREVSKNEVV